MSAESEARYAGLSHKQLFDALRAGNPGQLDELATSWHTVESTTRGIQADLDADLARLDWTSSGGTEFRRRLGLVSTYCTGLADSQGAVRLGIDEWRRYLAEAKTHLEDPADTDDHNSLVANAAAGAAAGSSLGPPGTATGLVVGAVFGHNKDEEEKKAARRRMLTVVANLADRYNETGFSYLADSPYTPQVDLPGDPGTDPDGELRSSGPSTSTPSGPGLGTAGTVPISYQANPGPVTIGPDGGAGDPSTTGTSLLGAGDAAVGAGAFGAGLALAGGALSVTPTALTAAVPSGGLAGGALPPGGVVRQPDPATQAVRRDGLGARQSTGSAAGAGRGSSGPGRGAPGERPGKTGHRDGAGVAGRTDTSDEGDEQTYDTWLTEDEMVWGNETDLPPNLIGERRPDQG
jgi:hypothetical protein